MLGDEATATTRRARERGSATLQYIGVLVIVLALLGAVAATVGKGKLGEQVEYVLCQAINKVGSLAGVESSGCQKPLPENLPRCVTYQQDRLLGINGSFRFIRAEVSGTDQILSYVNPNTGEEKALVVLGAERGAGIEAGQEVKASKLGKALKKKGFGFDAKAVLQGKAGVVYSFDSREEAQDFLDQRRGNLLKRAGGVLTGGVVDGIIDGGRKLFHSLTGQEDDGPTPSGLVGELGAQGEFTANFQAGKIPKTKGTLSPGIEGTIDGRKSARFKYNFDGSSRLTVSSEGKINLNGGVGLHKKFQKKHPLLQDLRVGGEYGWVGASKYTITFDKHGNPKLFRLTTESGNHYGFTAGGKVIKKAGKKGQVTAHHYTLDLSDPANMRALKQSLPNVLMSGASPRPAHRLLVSDSPLARRLVNNSVEYKQVYKTEGNALGGTSPDASSETGVKQKGVGLGYNNDTSRRTLVSTQYLDHRVPGSTWQDLVKCGTHD